MANRNHRSRGGEAAHEGTSQASLAKSAGRAEQLEDPDQSRPSGHDRAHDGGRQTDQGGTATARNGRHTASNKSNKTRPESGRARSAEHHGAEAGESGSAGRKGRS